MHPEAESHTGSCSCLRDWRPTLISALSRFPRPVKILLWPIALAAVIVPIWAGVTLFVDNVAAAWPSYVMRFTFGDRAMLTEPPNAASSPAAGADLPAKIRLALEYDQKVILGYFLVLLTCSMAFAVLAFARAGKRFSTVITAATIIAAVADAVENVLIAAAIDRMQAHPTPGFWFVFWQQAPAAVATLKWCALAIAVLAIPAFAFSVARVVLSHGRRLGYRRRSPGSHDWWDDSLAVDTSSIDGGPQAAWARNFCVPDAAAAIPRTESGAPARGERPTALCLSGGGIRSACVAMGAMEAISGPRDNIDNPGGAPPRLDDFDYVISVSGGGYTAGARLMAVQRRPNEVGGPGGATRPLAARFNLGSPEFEYVRQRSSYIADSPIALVRALAEVLKNLLASLLVVFSAAVLLGWVLGWFVAVIPLGAVVPVQHLTADPTSFASLQPRPVAALVAVCIPLAAAILCTVIGLIFEWASVSPRSALVQAWCDRTGKGAALFAVLVFTLTIALPWLMRLCTPLTPAAAGRFPTVGVVGGVAGVAILQYAATLFSMLRRSNGVVNPSRWRTLIPAGVLRIAPVLITLAAMFVAWALVLGIAANRAFGYLTADSGAHHQLDYFAVLAVIAVITWAISSFDVTSLSLHPFYRRRLARTFAVRRNGDRAAKYPSCEPTNLDAYGKSQNGGPKFIFAAAAAISDDRVRPAPGLNAVSYVMSADFIGGPALGWLKTPDIRRAAPARIERDLTVQAAVAISGAAFASAMGRQAKGFQTLLALSGARLGTWLPNPKFVEDARHNAADLSFPKSLPTLRGAGYLYRELFGINKSDARLVQVTDGGHYENLGLVEALRRRCRLIYCIDGGGDTPPLLSGLADAIRLAKFELGVEITFDEDTPYGIDNVAPGSGAPFPQGHAFHCLNSRISKGAIVRGKITYPAAAGLGSDPEVNTGRLIVAKAVLWRDLPEWVLTYAASFPAFPHDKTSDQWFDEAQFANYVELGRRIGAQLLEVPSTDIPPLRRRGPWLRKTTALQPAANGHRV